MDPYVSSISAIATVTFLGLLLWTAQRGKPTVDPKTGVLLFRHSILFRGFALFAAFGIPLGITILVIFMPPEKEGDTEIILGLYAFFAFLSAPLLWESMRFALFISPKGLDCRSPWRRKRFLPWNEVNALSYSVLNSWFVIRASDNWKFRVSILVPGLSKFLAQCEQHLPTTALAGAKLGYARVGRQFPDGQ